MMNGSNPLLPLNICIPDGEAHVMPDGKVYIYGSRDMKTDGFCSDHYISAYSSDMKNWDVIEEPVFSVKDVPWAKEGNSRKHSSLSKVKRFEDLPEHILAQLPPNAKDYPLEQIIAAIEKSADAGLPEEIRLYAPDAIHKDGKYYLYFCLSDDTEGAAVSDSPCGPFHDAVQLPVEGIDPAVFIDDDGSAYYYWGQFHANAAKLTDDMMHIEEGSIVENILSEKEHHFHEGSSMRKRGDTYYYVFADTSRGKSTCLGYATSKSPLGPFTYQGVIIDNAACDPLSWNIHGSIEEVNGQWYVFYHRSSNNSQYQRRLCAEPIFFDENGLIREVKMTSAADPVNSEEQIPACLACAYAGGAYLDTIHTPEGTVRMPPGSEAVFRYVQNTKTVTQITVNGTGNGEIEIQADGKTIGRGRMNQPSGIELTPGIHELMIVNGEEAVTLHSFQMI